MLFCFLACWHLVPFLYLMHIAPPTPMHDIWFVKSFLRFRESFQKIFDERHNLRKELMELDGSVKILALKIHKKELTSNRMNLLSTADFDNSEVSAAMK